MCVLNESPCILVFNVLCHILIRLGRTYGPSGLGHVHKTVLYSRRNCHSLSLSTHKATTKFYLLSCHYFFFLSKSPQFNIIVVTIVIIHSLTTFNWNPWLIFGSVLTWHSYVPESLICGDVILSVHSSDPSECSDWKRWSFVYVSMPTVNMCRSRFLIHDTWRKKK